jgi:hypothetical protein
MLLQGNTEGLTQGYTQGYSNGMSAPVTAPLAAEQGANGADTNGHKARCCFQKLSRMHACCHRSSCWHLAEDKAVHGQPEQAAYWSSKQAA